MKHQWLLLLVIIAVFVLNLLQFTLPFYVTLHRFDPAGNLSYSLFGFVQELSAASWPFFFAHLQVWFFTALLWVSLMGVFLPTINCIGFFWIHRPFSLGQRLLFLSQGILFLGGSFFFYLGQAGLNGMDDFEGSRSMLTPIGKSILVTLLAFAILNFLLAVKKSRTNGFTPEAEQRLLKQIKKQDIVAKARTEADVDILINAL